MFDVKYDRGGNILGLINIPCSPVYERYDRYLGTLIGLKRNDYCKIIYSNALQSGGNYYYKKYLKYKKKYYKLKYNK